AMAAITRTLLGEVREAERLWQRFRALSPFDPFAFLYEGLFAITHMVKRDHQAAINAARAVTQLNPGYSAGYKPYLPARGHLARAQEAAGVLRRLLSIEPGCTVDRCLAAIPLDRRADRDHFAEGLRLAGMA